MIEAMKAAIAAAGYELVFDLGPENCQLYGKGESELHLELDGGYFNIDNDVDGTGLAALNKALEGLQ